MDVNIDLPQLVSRIVETAYPELKQSRIKAQWGRSSSFATISWTQDLKDIRIRCSLETIEWHEAALTGLLAHELSHPAQGRKTQSERSTDLDAIERGFGPYLGTERLLAGKYDDHLIRRGKDRYLGYKTIRKQLDDNELKHLDALLKQIRLVPSRKVSKKEVHHDIVIIHSSRNTTIRVDGHEFILPLQNEDMEVRIVVKDSTTYVMVDNDEVGYFSNPTT
jgi:hypothetical protein